MQTFKLGPYSVEPSKGTISADGLVKTIEPKAMAVLCQLQARSGQVVSQQELFDAVWPDRIFSPSSLQRVIAIIRKALNETSQSPTFLFTHPKLGYRLEVPASEIPDTANSNISQKRRLQFFVCLLIVLGVLSVFFLSTYTSPPEETTFHKLPITHGNTAEFNGKLSPQGHWLSYQSDIEASQLFLVDTADLSSTTQIQFNHAIEDYVWLNNGIIAITRAKDGSTYIEQLSNIANSANAIVKKPFGQWRHIKALQIGADNTLYFVGKTSDLMHYIAEYDLVSDQSRFLHIMGETIVEKSLAYTPYGIYFHYFDGETKHFGRVSMNSEVEILAANTPDISKLSWLDSEQGLLVSDQLNAEQYIYRNDQLQHFKLTSEAIVQHVDNYGSRLVVTQSQPDSDVVQWQRIKGVDLFEKLINSKFNDYQATSNSRGDVAYLSTRSGYPQVFLKTKQATKLLFENKGKVSFIPPLLWSDNEENIAIIIDGLVVIIDTQTYKQRPLPRITNAKQLIQWKKHNLTYLDHNGDVLNYNVESGNTEFIVNKNESLIGVDNVGNQIGIKEGVLYWGTRKLALTTHERIRYVFALEEHIAVHIERLAGSKLIFLDEMLNTLLEIKLDSNCNNVTHAEYIDGDAHWLCTQFEANDSDIYLFEQAG
ncbi:transcriptional regulator [Thalassotalea euphylliae]|uniref:winged helix-turn-helix domain-containing protein n=1 Tax=Thalassotalea euphylliae TaxID=1655234 RepID=UPI003632E3D0